VGVASRPFQVFAKPAGAACNLACAYCYYLKAEGGGRPFDSAGSAGLAQGRQAEGGRDEVASDRWPVAGGQSPDHGRHADGREPRPVRMSDDVLEAYIAQHLEAAPEPDVLFSWHGGEPTLLGVEFYERVVALQRRHRRGGQRVANGIQTNGVLIDDDWCRFLARENFHVGLSLDGPADLHNAYRVTRGGGASHAQPVRAFERLRAHGVPCEILCVAHDRNVREPIRVYRFLKKLGAREMAFLPLVQPVLDVPGGVTPESVSAAAYGEFLCAIFDEWVERDRARIAVQIFDEVTRPARGLSHSLCIYRETCGDVPVVERDGSFYSCDHFVNEAHRVGSIREAALASLIDHPSQVAFGHAKRDALPRMCRECPVLLMCNGGCPKDRIAVTPDGQPGLNYLCAGLKRFFTHVLPFAVKVGLERPGVAAPAWLEPAAHPSRPAAGRNDPCPCGSGRKFKKCCGAVPPSPAARSGLRRASG